MNKRWATLVGLCVVFLIGGCSNERTINGRSERTAAQSVKIMKEYLPSDQRVEFEMAYWTLKDAIPDSKQFLDAVDGKNVTELILLGKEHFEQRKAMGIEAYGRYASWEDMIQKLIKERAGQSNNKDPRDKANNVLYDLH